MRPFKQHRNPKPLSGERGAMLLQWSKRRPTLTSPVLIVIIALLNACLYHQPLFVFASSRLEVGSFSGAFTVATLYVTLIFVTVLLLTLISVVSQSLLKPLCILAAFANAIALYFIQTYNVILDRTMIGNVLNTDLAEASDLWHPEVLLYLFVLGLLPALALAYVVMKPVRRWRLTAFGATTLIAGAGFLYAASGTWLWIDKHARSIGGMMLPWSYTVNLTRHHNMLWAANRQAEPLPAANFVRDEKTVVVLVIGESARANNFSMYDYERLTNPSLSVSGAVALANARSCATYTTAALLCMLSHDDPGLRLAGATEVLPSYLQRHGIDVIWHSNNSGQPPMRVATFLKADQLRAQCKGAQCAYDELLLTGVAERIRSSTARKIFIVLHQTGSHGPSYSKKYPASFEQFKPVCDSVDLSKCTAQSLVNAYDNTILYTDHMLGQAIGLLKEIPDLASTLIYMSDHGESLGEFGLYLHGTPMSIAPDVQKDVPLMVWMSSSFKTQRGIDEASIARGAAHSQANIFHSVMGAFDMRSSVYQQQLDIFSAKEPLKPTR